MQWFWLLVVLSCTWVDACPQGCSCQNQQGLFVANCSTLPTNGGKIESLTLQPTSESPIELTDGQFNSARHLKYLSLRNSSIYFVHKKAFYGVKGLIEIDLSFNYIEELDSTVFQHLTNLTTLILRGNAIQFLSEVPFLISNSLQHLDIGQCKIKSVPRGIFYGLKRLRYLSLDGNLLKSLKYNSLPKSLKYLDLSHNSIVNVPIEVISSLTNLRRLNLGGNAINCSCPLMNLQDWLSGRGVIFEDDVKCDLPPEYYGVSWSKVDENRLCLAEERKEDISLTRTYTPFLTNKLYRGNYLDNENSYLKEDFQSDQPQLHPDSQAEVLFQNDETVAMGEMMRDEENIKDTDEKDQTDLIKDAEMENTEGTEAISESPPLEKDIEEKSVDPQNDIDHEKAEFENGDLKIEESSNIDQEPKNDLENADLNSQDNEENKPEKENLESIEDVENTGDTTTNTTSSSITNTLEENTPNKENLIDVDVSQFSHSNESGPVEYKQINGEESNSEVDDLKKEGFFHVDDDTYNLDANSTLEESTVVPETEDTTEDGEDSTIIPPNKVEDNNSDDTISQNSTLSSENANGTVLEASEVMETVPPPILIPDLLATNNSQQNTGTSTNGSEPSVDGSEPPVDGSEPSVDPRLSPENGSLVIPVGESGSIEEEAETKEEVKEEKKIMEVAGAEVVMFCIGVLVICLVLYSIYKCRTPKKRPITRTVKDMESNHGTEMQDMASLIPKSQTDGKKNNLKYPDKAPESETMKLITEQSENETPSFTKAADKKNKTEDKNALNNNTSSPTSKTPLIKPGNPITINPAAPIQRTKVKVGIIPDSIPRTPIFLQKTYNPTPNNV